MKPGTGMEDSLAINREDPLNLSIGVIHLLGEGVSCRGSMMEGAGASGDLRWKDRKLVVAGFHGLAALPEGPDCGLAGGMRESPEGTRGPRSKVEMQIKYRYTKLFLF